MNLKFQYNKEKDIWCLLNKGKSSNNSQHSTKQYRMIVEKYGDSPSTDDAATFINTYITENDINISQRIEEFGKEWESISSEFQKRAEDVFGVSLPGDITAYLTVNSRCPYSIKDNCLYVHIQSATIRETVMHELWHFYTWYGLGTDQEERLGKEKYNDLKEALTVLLNVECADLFPDGVIDVGYPQHQEIREKILKSWKEDRDIQKLWTCL